MQEILGSGYFTECYIFNPFSEEYLIQSQKCDDEYFLNLNQKIKEWLRDGQTLAEKKFVYLFI